MNIQVSIFPFYPDWVSINWNDNGEDEIEDLKDFEAKDLAEDECRREILRIHYY